MHRHGILAHGLGVAMDIIVQRRSKRFSPPPKPPTGAEHTQATAIGAVCVGSRVHQVVRERFFWFMAKTTKKRKEKTPPTTTQK